LAKVGQNQTMVKIKHSDGMSNVAPEVPQVRFDNRRLTALGIEPMTLAELLCKAPASSLVQPQRLEFFLLMLVTAGQGQHTVDFVQWPLSVGTLLLVRPGQVQQWHMDASLAAHLVLIDPGALPHVGAATAPRELALLALDTWPSCQVLDSPSYAAVAADVARLRQDFERFDGSEADVALIRHQLLVLMLRLAKRQRSVTGAMGAAPSGVRHVHRLFLQALEADFARHHAVQHYAQRLGYAAATLGRACLAAEGRATKQVIDRRIALEAKRLLAHSQASVAEIAHRLGFSEVTNFVKFFRRMEGAVPLAFRQSLRVEKFK
jgi:AraC-like DNA-binding protein